MKTTNKILLSVFAIILLVILSILIVLKVKINMGVDTTNLKVIEQQRNIPKFNKIDVGNRFTIIYTQDSTTTLKLKADSSLLASIKTEVRNGTLYIDLTKDLITRNKVVVYITNDSINEVSLSEDCDFTNKKLMSVNSLKLGCNIRSTVNLNGNFGAMKLFMHLQSTGTIKGSCREFEFEGLEARLSADEFIVKKCNLNVKHGSKSYVNVTDELTVTAGSGSRVTYIGNPVIKNVDITGGAQLMKKK
jgi:hypothetical protein